MVQQTLIFEVLGRAAPQGSKRAIPVAGGVRLLEQSARVKPYRDSVAGAAREALDRLDEDGRVALYEAPVALQVTFLFARPKSHMRAGAFAGETSARAPSRPTSRQCGDVEKLVRAVNDALVMAGVIRDDSQVVQLVAAKRYAGPREPERTLIEVGPLARTVADAEREAVAA